MKQTWSILLLLLVSAFAMGQQDPKAKKILDDLSAKTKAYKTIKVKFKYTHENNQENITTSKNGLLFLKGEKYKLFLMGREVIFDGKTQTTIDKEMEEVTIVEPDLSDKTKVNPANMFNIYETGGYKYAYNKMLSDQNNQTQHVIDLFPGNARDSENLSKVRLTIKRQPLELVRIKYFGKDGNDYIISLSELNPNVTINDALFIFDERAYRERYPDLMITDTRK